MAPEKQTDQDQRTNGNTEEEALPDLSRLPEGIIPMEVKCPFCSRTVVYDVDERSDFSMVNSYAGNLAQDFFMIRPCPHLAFGMNGADNNLYIVIHPAWEGKMRRVFKELIQENRNDIEFEFFDKYTAKHDEEGDEDDFDVEGPEYEIPPLTEEQLESILDDLFSEPLVGWAPVDTNSGWWSLIVSSPINTSDIENMMRRLFPNTESETVYASSNFIPLSSCCMGVRDSGFMSYTMLFAKEISPGQNPTADPSVSS